MCDILPLVDSTLNPCKLIDNNSTLVGYMKEKLQKLM